MHHCSFFQFNSDPVRPGGACREGMGSAEATEMVLNNLFYITAKVRVLAPGLLLTSQAQ
jgi:hypothetical protein